MLTRVKPTCEDGGFGTAGGKERLLQDGTLHTRLSPSPVSPTSTANARASHHLLSLVSQSQPLPVSLSLVLASYSPRFSAARTSS